MEGGKIVVDAGTTVYSGSETRKWLPTPGAQRVILRKATNFDKAGWKLASITEDAITGDSGSSGWKNGLMRKMPGTQLYSAKSLHGSDAGQLRCVYLFKSEFSNINCSS